MKLEHARRLAAVIMGAMAPYCARIEVAGSVRRGRPWVNDVDFVVLDPNPAEFRQRAGANAIGVKDGPEILIVRLRDGTQVDFFFAHGPTTELLDTKPGNWGTVLLCRTGSKEHNIHLAQRAQKLGFKWETMIGLTFAVDMKGTQIMASETEEDIFKELDLPFIKPEDRERD